NQLRKLGVSADWSRERFTLDEGLSAAVLTAFNQLYQEGLIYRGNYLVNWCPASQSAVSDLEVENKEVDGNLLHFRYPLTDGSGSVEVATTRPETMLGDTAVAVNPDDERYRHLVGKTLRLPIMDREIPIIADEYVDAAFGTGCVKVTPAHDLNDFEMGKRHNLPFINIMNKDGSMNENAGPFQGLDRFEARKAVVQRLEEDGVLVRVEDYRHTVPFSDRGKVAIEPLLSTQWFVKIRPLAENALDFLDNQRSPRFVPERWTKVYRDWLVSLKDWCISRQLWWGHQIPAWYAVSETEGTIADNTPFFVAQSESEARAKAVEQFGSEVVLQQDPDVLDTWFSSGLWPFSTMGWPDETSKDFQTYYPTTTLVTGFDIIFFWVARMTMMAGHFTQTMPFETVYIHGLVRDENNKKMSKSANNGIDPLLLINKYGTDALRYTLVREVAGAGQDIRLEYDRKTDESIAVEASRNFTNKLWNASRFVMMNLEGKTPAQLGQPDPGSLELADRWILSRFNQVVQKVRGYLGNYGMGEAAKELYDFIWGDFCDWYIELVKPRLQAEGSSKLTAQQTLAFVLEGILKLLHPFMPHITEELWHTLTQTGDNEFLAVQLYPAVVADQIDPSLEEQFELLIGTIRTIRNLRAEAGIKPGARIETILKTENPEERRILLATETYIRDTAKVEKLTIEGEAPPALPASEGVPESDIKAVAAEVSDFWTTLQPLAYLSKFFSSIRRPALTLLLLFGLLMVFLMLSSLFSSIELIPGLASLLRLVGVGYTLWFTSRYLLKAEKRQRVWGSVGHWRREVLGEPRALPAAAEPKLIKAAEPTLLLPPAGATEASNGRRQQPQVPQQQLFAGVVGTVQVLIPLTGYVDVEALRAKLEKDLGKVEVEIKALSGRLSNAGFVDKAPAEVVQGARDALAEAQKQAEILQERLALL
ncbi:MAG: valine--tRNA ligase, partial [Cyanobacteria bacterium Co-bin8]|nr:valine--tRNA ligase [Cyanobacteria bacterium Co-bin8]